MYNMTSLKMFIIMSIILVIPNFVSTEDLCTKAIPSVTSTCSVQNSPYCCNGAVNEYCSGNTISDDVCRAGFYEKGNLALNCPKGYFCPQGYKCMIPCNTGIACLGSEMVSNSTLCKDLLTGSTSNAVMIDGISQCPGTKYPIICDEGYYCPNPAERFVCPEGKICALATAYPMRCNLFESCAVFGAGDVQDVVGLILLGFLIFVVIIVLVVRYQLDGKSILIGYSSAEIEIPSNQNHFRKTFNLNNGLWSFSNVDIEGQRHNLPQVKHSLSVCVRDFTFTLKNGHRLLRNINAHFRHSRLNILMGPSGCGKSTIINALMGKSYDHGTITGKILVNGVEMESLRRVQGYVGYVMQQDLMHENLTVKEILTYQAQLRLPKAEDDKYITSSVQEIITLLSLTRIGDRVVGLPEDNMISGGQRKRISIGMELVANPSILILDEPTSGLDSATSLMIIQLLRSLSRQTNINIMCVIHQPRVELFRQFDTTTLLSSHGCLVYNGEAALMTDYFKNLGFQFPADANPADIMIDLVCGFVVSTKCSVKQLHRIWKNKESERRSETENNNNEETEDPLVNITNEKRGIFHQTGILLHRESVCMLRSFFYNVKEVCIILVLGILFAYLFRTPDFYVQKTRYALESLFVGLIGGLSGSVKIFGNDMMLFMRESSINTTCYFTAKVILHLPVIFFFTPVAMLGIYWTAGSFYAPYRTVYIAFALAVFAVSGLTYVCSILFKQKLANLICLALILIFSLTSGTVITICELDEISVIGPVLYYISFAKWFVQARMTSESDQYLVYHEARLRYLWHNKYTEDDFTDALWGMIVIGVITRLIALLLLIYRKSIFQLSSLVSCVRCNCERNNKKERVLDSHVSAREFKFENLNFDENTFVELKI